MPENHRDLKARVLEYLENNRGKRIYLTNIAKELDEAPRRVQQTISFIRRQQDDIKITVVVRGYTWFVEPAEPTNDEDVRVQYAEVHTLKNGVLLERSDGQLFKAILTKVD